MLKEIKGVDSGLNSTIHRNSIIFTGHRHGYIEHIYIQLQKRGGKAKIQVKGKHRSSHTNFPPAMSPKQTSLPRDF